MTIQHTVVFALAHAPGSPEETEFLDTATRVLSAIGTVTNFTVRRQISPKSDVTWQFSMDFGSAADYEAYNSDPAHVEFVSTRWSEAVRFAEYDFAPR